MNKRTKVSNRWTMFRENNPTAHVCFLLIVVNIIFIGCSALLISVLPENEGHSLGELLRLAFTLMVNPSGKYIYSEAPVSLIITTIVVLLGMISLTGGTVGFVTSVISGILEKSAHSKRKLKIKNHIVILNYNHRVPSIVCDYCFDDVSSTYLVILTDRDRDAVTKEIDEVYNRFGMKRHFRNIIVRTGSPYSKLDLDSIALADAKTVLLMTPENENGSPAEDAQRRGFAVSKLFLFVTAYLDRLNANDIGVVVETTGREMDDMIRGTKCSRSVVGIEHDQVIGKLLGVMLTMPSIHDVLRQLFSFEGVEIYTRPVPGQDIAEELRTNRSVMPVYDMGDMRVYVAEDEAEFGRTGEPFTLTKPLPAETIELCPEFTQKEIVIIGINNKLQYILESLQCFKRKYENEELHVILADAAERREDLQRYYDDPFYADILMPGTYGPVVISNLYRPMNELAPLVQKSADTLLFLSDDDESTDHLDEKPLLYWSDVHGGTEGEDGPCVIVELKDPANQNIIEHESSGRILISDDFLGRLYAQLGKNPVRKDIIMDFITAEGDSASVGEDDESEDAGDLLCVKVSSFLNGQDLHFASRRELIVWVNEATGGKVVPLGLVRDGVSYLFSRTDGESDALDSDVLLGIAEGETCPSDGKGITLRPDDELAVFLYS